MLAQVEMPGTEDLYPSALSGGMRKRVALARSIAIEPEAILYDEPTTGLDPITATTITDLIVKVRDLDGASSILVTHQLRDAFNVARTFVRKQGGEFGYQRIEDLTQLEGTDFLMLREGRVVFEGSPHALLASKDPYIRDFLS
jgi:phospholipid/cholesterol/gamma-HCH transport system ATP-binding protein